MVFLVKNLATMSTLALPSIRLQPCCQKLRTWLVVKLRMYFRTWLGTLLRAQCWIYSENLLLVADGQMIASFIKLNNHQLHLIVIG